MVCCGAATLPRQPYANNYHIINNNLHDMHLLFFGVSRPVKDSSIYLQ